MDDAATFDMTAAHQESVDPTSFDNEAYEVARLLAEAGIDHASALWFQLLELATQQACEWAERCLDLSAPLSARAAAVLGLRSLAVALLAPAPEQDDVALETAAAEACLRVCAEAEAHVERLPDTAQRRRRWGEGAIPRPQSRPRLLQITAGCC